MIYLSTREILQNMDIFKDNSNNFSKFLKNVINDLHKLCFQNYQILVTSTTYSTNTLGKCT